MVNKKKVQRIMQKFNLQVTAFTIKSRKNSSYKGKVGTVAPIGFEEGFIHLSHTQRLLRTLQSSNTMKWMPKGV